MESKLYKLNKYSLSTSNLQNWLDNLMIGVDIWGSVKDRDLNVKNEIKDLNNFKRGIYLKNIIVGSKLKKKKIMKFVISIKKSS